MPRSLHTEGQKAILIQDFRNTRSSILDAAARLPDDRVATAFVGSWGILELLAHLRGWDLTNLESIGDILQGRLPGFYAERDSDWASYNASLVAQHMLDELSRMIASVNESHFELLELLDKLTPEDIFGDHGVRRGSYKVTISRLIQAETKDEQNHLEQIRHFLELATGKTDPISA